MSGRIRQVQVKNYKSLAAARVTLSSLTILVGPNGSGKSNFLDVLAFVQEALARGLDLALQERGGIDAVRRRSTGYPTHVSIQLSLNLPDGMTADYAFEIAPVRPHGFRIAREWCVVNPFLDDEKREFHREGQEFPIRIEGVRAQIPENHFALFAASATPAFRPVFDFLTGMRFYSIVPGRLRELQDADAGELLKPDGSNAAAVLRQLARQPLPAAHERVLRLLGRAVPGIRRVEARTIGPKESLEFLAEVGPDSEKLFSAINMSDGTLRLLGLLLAVYQPGKTTLIGIEEPEATVHPAVAELLLEVLQEAAAERQVVVTTHSPDLLDSRHLELDQVRAVQMQHGRSVIGPIAEPNRALVREDLFTLGELLRQNEIEPEVRADSHGSQLELFTPVPVEAVNA